MTVINLAVITGGHSYEVLPFHALFRAMPGVDATIQHIEDFVYSPREVRDGYDALVFYIMPRGGPDDEPYRFGGRAEKAFGRLGETSQGIVMLHHAILAYPEWPKWDAVVGMQRRVITKYSHDERIPVQVAAPEHPIVQGLAPWTIVDETYVLHDPGADSQVLLTTDHPACMRSLAWVRMYQNSRVFCYESGHDHQAWEDGCFQKVLGNGIRWVAGNFSDSG